MAKQTCSLCKKDIDDKYFYLSIRRREYSGGYSQGYKDALRLRLCSWDCLVKIIEDPKIIIVELLI